MFFRYFIVFCLLFITFKCLASTQVFPTRVILDDQQRVSTISVRNKSNETTSYTIKAVFYRMAKDGSVKMVRDIREEERSIAKYLRFSPRKLTLRPGEEQVVRIMLKNTKKLAQGDYRAHLRILPKPKEEAKNLVEKKAISMKINTLVAIAISVFYYKGKPDLKAALSNFTFAPHKKDKADYVFSAKIKNTGTNFLIDSLYLYFTDKNGKESLVGKVKGISSYIPERSVTYKITPETKTPLKNGKVKLVFQGPKYLGGPIVAMTELTL